MRATRGALTRSVIAASMIATRVIGCMGVDPNLLGAMRATPNCRAGQLGSQSKFGRPSQKSRFGFRRARMTAATGAPGQAANRNYRGITARIFPSTRR